MTTMMTLLMLATIPMMMLIHLLLMMLIMMLPMMISMIMVITVQVMLMMLLILILLPLLPLWFQGLEPRKSLKSLLGVPVAVGGKARTTIPCGKRRLKETNISHSCQQIFSYRCYSPYILEFQMCLPLYI